MSDSYFGIGKLNFILFLVIFMLVVGIVNVVFNPTAYGLGEQNMLGYEGGVFQDQQSQPADNNIFTAISQFVALIFAGLTLLSAGFYLNIPGIPMIVNLLLCVPVDILLVIVIIDIVRDILGGWHDFISSLKPFG